MGTSPKSSSHWIPHIQSPNAIIPVGPDISADAQSTILDLLCNFLRPIGDHRSQHLKVSTVKRRNRGSKRKRSVEETLSENHTKKTYPEALDFVTIGHNMTIRHLAELAQKSRQTLIHSQIVPATASSRPDLPRLFVAVFVSRAGQPPMMHPHLPYLIKAASLFSPSLPSMGLITLPSGAEARLSNALGIRRVGLVGLLYDSPGALDLVDVLRLKRQQQKYLGFKTRSPACTFQRN